MKKRQQVEAYLAKAGYWAAMAVHLRKLLNLSHTASPFREFAELARSKIQGK